MGPVSGRPFQFDHKSGADNKSMKIYPAFFGLPKCLYETIAERSGSFGRERHFIHCLVIVLVQPRKTCPDMIEKLLTGT